MTRAELATVFFRLISAEDRANYWTQENRFDDVWLEHWYNNAVSTTTNMGVFNGICDELFAPHQFITRAELAAAMVRLVEVLGLDVPPSVTLSFSDIAGHWARDYIQIAASSGWVFGYPNGSFDPNQPVTRAQAAAMLNRLFERVPESVDALLPDMITWPDNADPESWYYLYIQAASNSYIFERRPGSGLERWISILDAPRNWTLLERPDSTPNSIFGSS